MRRCPKPLAISRREPHPGQARVGGATTAPDVDLPRGGGASVTAGRAPGTRRAAAALLVLAACSPYVQGNGVYCEEERERPPFAGIRAADAVAVVVTVRPGEPQTLTVIGDSNVVPHVETEVEPLLVGTASVPALRVWVSEPYESVIPPTVAITLPSLRAVHGRDGSSAEVRQAEGATFTGEPLDVVLAAAALDASAHPVAAASVALSGRSTARLRSAGPVVGTASGEARLVNTGAGECEVEVSGGAAVLCE